jgi:hypothetical protein
MLTEGTHIIINLLSPNTYVVNVIENAVFLPFSSEFVYCNF